MARPVKNYCDYFPHDRDMRNHRKIKAIRTKYKISGYGIWCMILEYLTGIDGNVFEYSDVEMELMAGDFGVSATEIRDVVDYCIKLELLFLKDGFIQSESLDERLKPVYDKRGVSKFKSKKQSRINGRFSTNNTDSYVVSEAETPQSKVNKSIVNDTINTEGRIDNDDILNSNDMSKKNEASLIPLPFDSTEFSEKWAEWLQYRKERKLGSYTPTGLKSTFTNLKKITQNDPAIAIEVIEQSLANGWQGLFELKQQFNGAKTNIPNTTTSNGKPGTSSSRLEALKKF